MTGEILIAGQRFKSDAPVVPWTESGWDATREQCIGKPCVEPTSPAAPGLTKRYALRPALRSYQLTPPLEAVQKVVRQVILHHDGMANSATAFDVMHNERGLSCHFYIDNDGTIYQTLDLALLAFHAAEFNQISVGVMFANVGDARRFPNAYANDKRRSRVMVKVNEHAIESWSFTDAQYDAFLALARALTKLLPAIALEYPAGHTTLPWREAWAFSGFAAYFHFNERKWSAGMFEFRTLDRLKPAKGNCFPIALDAKATEPRIVPDEDLAELATTTAAYHANAEGAAAGSFPVGPWGASKLWHGGLHLAAPEGAPIYAMFPGRVLAVRGGEPSPIGSTNFVLIEHAITVGGTPLRFFSLTMHVDDPLPPSPQTNRVGLELTDQRVAAGEVIGKVARVGPSNVARGQVHVELFATVELLTAWDLPLRLVDGSRAGRLCDAPAILGATRGDPRLRDLVTLHVSEWTSEPAWKAALDDGTVPSAELDAMIAEQITPGLWWTTEVAQHARLPRDGVVYHYHPIRFLELLQRITIASRANAATAGSLAATQLDVDPVGAVDRDLARVKCDDATTLEHLQMGDEAPSCDATPRTTATLRFEVTPWVSPSGSATTIMVGTLASMTHVRGSSIDLDIQAGPKKLRVEVSHSGYQTYETDIVLDGDRTLKIELKKRTASGGPGGQPGGGIIDL